MLNEGVILLHDNEKPHIARKTQELLQKFKWEVWSHPPYSPDLASSDYFLFFEIERTLIWKRFSSESDVKTAGENWINGHDLIFIKPG
ncbi:hypothetical protein AVEN_28219-1 [Araneus ventricosus]|uniref:Histone-lysine N-methyltransferase SETMAR n=1 Tax=Araneus ventricosus TaxID=182803 RepID=A0A4Y2EYY4_ARAVE|nr:hypothetical protein AVEN_28219-1 [Araneus ventricosus]